MLGRSGGCGLFYDWRARTVEISYASDLTDPEWALLEPLIPRSHPAGRRQIYPLRRIVDAILYLLRTGAQWRMLPMADAAA
jgi:transposase